MFVIVFNQTNIVPDGQNNKLVFKFPNSVKFDNHYIAVSSVSMYYSWFNITSALSNNTFSYTWVDHVGLAITYTLTIPDGIYDISDLNKFIQFSCIQNGTYWVIGGVNYYPFEFLLNPSRYAVQINTYLIPTVAPPGTTQSPAPIGGTAGWPTHVQNVAVDIPINLTAIMGFSAPLTTNINYDNLYIPPVSPYVAKDVNGTLSYLSDVAPQVQPNGSIYLAISNVNNPYTQPSSIIYAINPSVASGEQIVERPPNYSWSKLINGTYNEIRMTFLGTDKNPIPIRDPNMTILLVIRDSSEGLLAIK